MIVTGSMIRAVHISKIFVSQITRSATTIFGSFLILKVEKVAFSEKEGRNILFLVQNLNAYVVLTSMKKVEKVIWLASFLSSELWLLVGTVC